MSDISQFKEYFLNDYDLDYTFDVNAQSDIYVTGIYNTNLDHLLLGNGTEKKSKVNILICIENILNKRFSHYTHYNKFGEYGDDRIDIYIYNHIYKMKQTEKYLAIPFIYFRMDYFRLKYDNYFKNLELNVPFKEKKFCLMINKSGFNKDIDDYVKKLNKIEKVDNISMYNDEIVGKSCYNSMELLKVFNRYKFVLCVENSYSSGYVTEKIFNVFFSKAIPIYSGSDKIETFFNKDSFVNMEDNRIENCLEKIKTLNEDEGMYNRYMNADKVSLEYNDENYKKIMRDYVERFCGL